jgi:hypothetical protein
MRPNACLLAIALASLLVAACGDAPPSATAARRTRDPRIATPSPTVDVTAIADAAAFGPWRRKPIATSPAVAREAERACRDQDRVGSLPLRVLDARGEGLLTLVFADDATAVVCHAAAAEGGGATADARTVAGLASAAAPERGHLGPHDLQVIETASGARHVIVGRVAEVPSVQVAFDDWTWGTATMADGWYAAWWPQAAPALTVASVDLRGVVIDSFGLEP